MSAPHTTGGASAPSNVVRFPSAVERDTRRFAAFMGDVERQPALLLVMALIRSQPQETKTCIAAVTGEAVSRNPECLPTWQAHQIAMTLSGFRKEGQ